MAAAAVGAAHGNASQPIPTDLARRLPNPHTPWHFSRDLFERMRKQGMPAGKRFNSCEVLTSDPEHYFVCKYFFAQKPPGLSIRKIVCIHNPYLAKGFEAALIGMESEVEKLRPAWNEEEPKELRAKTTRRWEEQTKQFSPFELRCEDRLDRFEHIKVLPLWHGTSQVESICEIGFKFFGKHHKFHASAGPGPQASTDVGYFGSGIYFTNSARYAAMYNKGSLLLSWIVMRQPYPVVSDVPIPQKCSDMKKLEGHGAYQNSNGHFIPVVSIKPHDPRCMQFHPCSEMDQPVLDEFVVFQPNQTLPRFSIELGVDFPSAPSANGKNALHLAVEAGNRDAVLDLCKNIELLFQKDSEGFTPLLLAAKIGSRELYEVLLKAGADPFATNNREQNALHLAAMQANTDFVLLLAAQRELLEARDKNGRTPLLLSAYSGQRTVCETLLKMGAYPLVVDDLEQNGLHLSALQGKADVVVAFVGYKALLEAKDKEGLTPILRAAQSGHRHTCEALLKAGANHHATNNQNRNALHVAASAGKTDVVQTLTAFKELIESRDAHGNTPLLLAGSSENPETCEVLLQAGANPTTKNSDGTNVLHIAVSKGSIAIVRTLVKRRELLELTTDGEEYTPLMCAARSGHLKVCEILVYDEGVNLLATNHRGQNALHVAAIFGKLEVMQLLVNYKELLVRRDKEGLTPLLSAAVNGQREAFEVLLKAGSQLTAVTNGGQNALHVAARAGKTVVVQALVVYKDLLEGRDKDGYTPFLRAAANGHLEVCEILLKASAHLTALTGDGQNVLHIAASEGKRDVLQAFVVHKDLLESRDAEDYTPFLRAVANGHCEACEILLKAGANINAHTMKGNALHLAVRKEKSNVVSMLSRHKKLLEGGFQSRSPLLAAVALGLREIMEILLKAGANSSRTNALGNILHCAARHGKAGVIDLLVGYKGLLEERNRINNHTPLMEAAAGGHRETCEALLKAGACLTQEALHAAAAAGKTDVMLMFFDKMPDLDKEKHEALLVAAANGHHATCEALLKMQALPSHTNAEGQNALHVAALNGRASVVQMLVHEQLIESRDAAGWTPLLCAASKGDRVVCEMLFAAGASACALTKYKKSALHLAAEQGHTDVIHLFSANKDLRDAPDHYGDTPLLLAAKHGHRQALEALIKAGANVSVKASNGFNALHCAAEAGHTDVVQALVAYEELVNARSQTGNTPLLLAAHSGHIATCEILLKAGADPFAVDRKGFNALHLAVKQKISDVVQLFVKHKKLLESRDANGNTPLLLAARSKNLASCEALLEAGAKHDVVDLVGANVLHLAIQDAYLDRLDDLELHKQYDLERYRWDDLERSYDLVRALVRYKDLIEVRDKEGYTPLLRAARGGDISHCFTLLGANAKHDVVDSFGSNMLHLAAIRGNIDLVSVLLKYKELIEASDKEGYTPLLRAAKGGHYATCETLLKAGANLLAVTTKGENALHLAAEAHMERVVQHVVAANRKLIDSKTLDGHTPLMLAARHGHSRVCEFLLHARADVWATNNEKQNALHLAAEAEHVHIVEMFNPYRKSLLSDLFETQDKNGRTALLIAASNGHHRTLNYLQGQANLEAVDNDQRNVVHLAAMNGKTAFVEHLTFLKRIKSLAQAKDKEGHTPFLLAVKGGHREICQMLLKLDYGNGSATDNLRQNAIHLAASRGHTNILSDLLRDFIDLVDATDEHGFTQLLRATVCGQRESCEMLLKAGANPLARTHPGSNIVHLAVRSGKTDMVQMFIVHKELLNERDERGFTPLMLAADLGHREICAILVQAWT